MRTEVVTVNTRTASMHIGDSTVHTGMATVRTEELAVFFEDSLVMTVWAVVSHKVCVKNTLKSTVTFLFVTVYKYIHTTNSYSIKVFIGLVFYATLFG